MAEKKDYYAVLGVTKQASADELKSAYRRLAKMYHPDVFATAPEEKKKEAEEKFKEITHAYEVLSDPQKKAAYDQYGSEDGPMAGGGAGGFGGFDFSGFGGGNGGGYSDIFDNIFSAFTGGGGRRGASMQERDGDDIEVNLNLTFKEACFGVTDKEITFSRIEKCPTCGGTGAKDSTKIHVCTKCGGKGRVVYGQRTPFGVMQTERVCDACGGSGKIIDEKCPDCRGQGRVKKQRTIKVNIPAGVDNGQMLTMKGEGNCAPTAKGYNGNLILVFKVASHPLFNRDNANISFELPITMTQAALGAKIEIPTLTTPISIDVPEGTQDGTVLRVKGKGIKNLRSNSYGDLFVKISVDIPKSLSMRQRAELKNMEDTLSKAKYDKVDKYNKILRNL